MDHMGADNPRGGVTAGSGNTADPTEAPNVCKGESPVSPVGRDERIVNAMQASREGVSLVGSGGRIRVWDAGMASITGIPASEAVGNLVHEVRFRLVPEEQRGPEELERLRIQYEELLSGGQAQDAGIFHEEAIQRPDGARRLIESALFVVPLDEGVVAAGVSRDVTAQREIAHRIEALARFPAESPHPIMRITCEGCLIYANDASAPLLAAWECVPGELLPPEWVERVRRALAEGQSLTVEAHAGDRVFALTLAPVAAHDEVNVFGMDVTARLRAEQALHLSERALRRAFEHAPSGVAIVSPHGRITEANQALADLTGYTPEALARLDWEAFVHPDDVEGARALMVRALAGGPESFRTELRVLRNDGEIRWAMIDGVLMRDTMGEPVHYLLQVQDETERRRADDLALRVAIATRVAEAEEHERRRVSQELHDRVGQELTALGISLGILRRQWPSDVAPAIATRLDDALSLVEGITASVRDVMAELRPPMLDEYGLLAALRWYAGVWSARVNVSVNVAGRDPTPRLSSHVAIMMFRIVQEALANTARHAQATRVYVRLVQRGGIVRLSVADNGRGFKPEATAAIGVEGGWGLRTMAERAAAVGARLRIESRIGGGTRVVVELPFVEERVAALDERASGG